MAILAVSVLFFIMIVSIILLSVTYVLQSIALMEIGKRKGEENSWLAWIPFARDYFFGKVAYGDNKNSIIYISVLYGARFASILISVIISSLLILIEEPELAKKCGKNAAKIKEEQAVEKIVDQWVGVIESA